MTLNEYIKLKGYSDFNSFRTKMSEKYVGLRVNLKNDGMFSYVINLNPRVDITWGKTSVQSANGVIIHLDADNLAGYDIDTFELLAKKDCTADELVRIFSHISDVFSDTYDFQVKYGLMKGDEINTLPPYFIEKSNLMMKIGHLKEELAEIEKAAENNDLTEFADGIIDLIYVAAGLGNLCRLPMHQLWNDVQNSNMVGKERVVSIENATKRGSTFDVRKTADWVGPRGKEIIEKFSNKN